MPHFIEKLPYTLDAGLAARASIGLIVLASDYTIEAEWRALFNQLSGVALYHARIANDDEVNPETLRAMAPRLTATAATLTPGSPLSVIAYGCTSASMAIGEESVFNYIRQAKPESLCTTPITAAFAAFTALNAKRVAVLTPYTRSVNEIVVEYMSTGGIEIPVFGSFDEPLDSRVARISDDSVAAGVRAVVDKSTQLGAEIDAVFVSCTSVRLMNKCAELEQEIGVPVTSSNHAMAWHTLRLAGISDTPAGLGKLFDCPLIKRS